MDIIIKISVFPNMCWSKGENLIHFHNIVRLAHHRIRRPLPGVMNLIIQVEVFMDSMTMHLLFHHLCASKVNDF